MNFFLYLFAIRDCWQHSRYWIPSQMNTSTGTLGRWLRLYLQRSQMAIVQTNVHQGARSMRLVPVHAAVLQGVRIGTPCTLQLLLPVPVPIIYSGGPAGSAEAFCRILPAQPTKQHICQHCRMKIPPPVELLERVESVLWHFHLAKDPNNLPLFKPSMLKTWRI